MPEKISIPVVSKESIRLITIIIEKTLKIMSLNSNIKITTKDNLEKEFYSINIHVNLNIDKMETFVGWYYGSDTDIEAKEIVDMFDAAISKIDNFIEICS